MACIGKYTNIGEKRKTERRGGERLENDNERNQKVKEAELSKKEVNVAMEKADSISLSAFGGMSSKEGRFD